MHYVDIIGWWFDGFSRCFRQSFPRTLTTPPYAAILAGPQTEWSNTFQPLDGERTTFRHYTWVSGMWFLGWWLPNCSNKKCKPNCWSFPIDSTEIVWKLCWVCGHCGLWTFRLSCNWTRACTQRAGCIYFGKQFISFLVPFDTFLVESVWIQWIYRESAHRRRTTTTTWLSTWT